MIGIHFNVLDDDGEMHEIAACTWPAVPRKGERVKLDGLCAIERLGQDDPPTEAAVFVVDDVLWSGEATMVDDAYFKATRMSIERAAADGVRLNRRDDKARRLRVDVLLVLPPEARTWQGATQAHVNAVERAP